jgi:predicted ATP-grasp superfamily ATP-dependent carboligase
MISGGNDLVIIGRSARALAESANRGGRRACVVDCFADMDTQASTNACERCALDGAGNLDEQALLAALRTLPTRTTDPTLIYGAGLEAMPGLLERLGSEYEIAGNGPEVLRAVKDPVTFCAALRALRIPHPQSRFTTPEDTAHDWLVKRAGGTGGGHVRRWDGAPVLEERHYLQRYLPGPVMSALFAADGRRARIIGFNTQWTTGHGAQPFVYAGAVNRARLTLQQTGDIAAHVSALTRAFGLRGLNGVDFIPHGDQAVVLEINARPTATCELYEPETSEGMVALHISACNGALPSAAAAADTSVRGHAIAYAPLARQVPATLQWPQWCHDLPRAGSRIAAGEPICSVHAEGDEIELVERGLHARCEHVLNLFTAWAVAA